MKKKAAELDALLFVDTNVLLDFYRIRKSDISTDYLTQLENITDRLILGSQVEMEYKKNRQTVILEANSNFSAPDFSKLTAPAMLSDLQAVKMIQKKKQEIIAQKNVVSEKIKKILSDPTHHDPVYQCFQRIFKSSGPYNLMRPMPERFAIRSLARKRFVLGYPPRKKTDNSIGDAVNWEWIIKCAQTSGKHVIIVSRDTDYGVTFDGQSYLNDFLRQEFSQRVSKQRKILLTEKLSTALKTIHAAVTAEMEEEESRIIAESLSDFEDLTADHQLKMAFSPARTST